MNPPRFEAVQLGAQTHLIGTVHDGVQAGELVVKRKDLSHRFRLLDIDDQAAGLRIRMRIVSQRGYPAHPKPFFLGCGNLVPDPLGRHLALELGKGQKHVERQPAHRRGGVESLGDRDEGTAGGIEALDQLGEIGKGSGQAVDLVDHNHLNEPRVDVCQQALKAGPVERAAGDSTVVIPVFARNGIAPFKLTRSAALAEWRELGME